MFEVNEGPYDLALVVLSQTPATDWDGHIWVWAKNEAGKEGWIPDRLFRAVTDSVYASIGFSALELTCYRGDELKAIDEAHGWVLCRAVNGQEGWVPARNLERL